MHRAAAVALFFFAATAQADPGHGFADLWHLLTEPDHLAMIVLPVAIAVGVGVGARFSRSSRKRKDPPG
jgi:hypothetical protein